MRSLNSKGDPCGTSNISEEGPSALNASDHKTANSNSCPLTRAAASAVYLPEKTALIIMSNVAASHFLPSRIWVNIPAYTPAFSDFSLSVYFGNPWPSFVCSHTLSMHDAAPKIVLSAFQICSARQPSTFFVWTFLSWFCLISLLSYSCVFVCKDEAGHNPVNRRDASESWYQSSSLCMPVIFLLLLFLILRKSPNSAIFVLVFFLSNKWWHMQHSFLFLIITTIISVTKACFLSMFDINENTSVFVCLLPIFSSSIRHICVIACVPCVPTPAFDWWCDHNAARVLSESCCQSSSSGIANICVIFFI